MSCCVKPTREQFLTEKLANFKRYLEPHCTTEEHKTALAKYNTLDSAMPYLLQAVAVSSTGSLTSLVDAFCAKFPSPPEGFREKVSRYILMFVEVLTS